MSAPWAGGPSFTERRRANPIAAQPLQVDIRDGQRVVPAEPGRLLEDRAVLRDQAMATEDEVGRRFVYAAGGVDVPGDASPRLVAHELPPVWRLADDLVRRREIQQQVRPGERLPRTRRHRHPQVFADL